MDLVDFRAGKTYAFKDVAVAFGMKPAVLTWQGGIISRPAQNALLVITKLDLESIDYHDRWEGADLVYGARGQKGDQQLTGANRLLATNARTNYVFESIGGAEMRFRGVARAVQYWWDEAPGTDGVQRRVVRYLLRFSEAARLDDTPDLLVDAEGDVEGERVFRLHIAIERSRVLVAEAKRRWKRQDPLLRCEACRMSFADTYGQRGENFIEAHHRVPLASLDGTTATRIQDLAPVCANCHRMLHKAPGCSIDELKVALTHRTA